jgi:hypothetical protein
MKSRQLPDVRRQPAGDAVDMAMDVNRNAPVVAEVEVFTHAALTTVWNLHTDIDRWSDWNPYIELRDWLSALTKTAETNNLPQGGSGA